MTARVGTWCLVGAGVAVAASVAAALAVLGSPLHQRAQRFDERRASDLSRIEDAIAAYRTTEGHLPARLSELAATDSGLALVDPSTGAPYGYRRIDARHYALCAVFATDDRRDEDDDLSRTARWRHPAGPHCAVRALPKGSASEPDSDTSDPERSPNAAHPAHADQAPSPH